MSGYPCTECGRNVEGDVCEHCGQTAPEPVSEAKKARALLADKRREAKR